MTYHAGRLAPWHNHGNKERSRQLYPQLENTPDVSRGDARLAAEVALSVLTCRDVPSFAHERAFETLKVLANG